MKTGSRGISVGGTSRETVVNAALSRELESRNPRWVGRVLVERTGVFADGKALRPDIVVLDNIPVVIETEYEPARAVEADAKSRLGKQFEHTPALVEQVLAVRIPKSIGASQTTLSQFPENTRFSYCVISGERTSPQRWPASGWIEGSIDDLAVFVEQVGLSEQLVIRNQELLERAVQRSLGVLSLDVPEGFENAMNDFGRVLSQEPCEQTSLMALTIVANAFVFHRTIAGTHGIPMFDQLRNTANRITKTRILDCWREIMDTVNYWPIFKVGSDLIGPMRDNPLEEIIDLFVDLAQNLATVGIASMHDLSGRMLQRLIVDRKFLATFYTLPTSAALLAELAVDRLDVNWADETIYSRLRIADFACGTGTLLTAAYQSVLRRFRHLGEDDSRIHPAMIENSVIAADIMPAAAHLTASQLSSVHPGKLFSQTQVFTMPYGIQTDEKTGRGIALGSLDLIEEHRYLSILSTGAAQVGGTGPAAEMYLVDVPHESIDLVIMNPPFTRPTNHESTSVPIPSFAGFRTSEDEQRSMAKRLKSLRTHLDFSVGNGYAGLASDFIDLAHAKLKPGGVLALVLPLTALQGASWEKARSLLRTSYCDIQVVTLAATGSRERAFSADTGMAELLLVATKRTSGYIESEEAGFVNLVERPRTVLEALEIARLVSGHRAQDSDELALSIGEDRIGNFLRAPISSGGCASLRNTSPAVAMLSLQQGSLQLPRMRKSLQLSVTTLGSLGDVGPVHRLIGSRSSQSFGRPGPLLIRPREGIPTYPIFWRHDAERERTMELEPESMGEPRSGRSEEAVDLWETAARLHFNLDFRLNSQCLAACLSVEPALGGRAWPSFLVKERRWEKAIALWANSTLGLVSFWWTGSRQQQGRAVLTVSSLPKLLMLDISGLDGEQLARIDELWHAYSCAPLLPANEAYQDDTRQALDRDLLLGVLGFSESVLEPVSVLRSQWCAEPTVHGGKATRIPA